MLIEYNTPRESVLAVIKTQMAASPNYKVIDIGGGTSFAYEFVHTCMDYGKPNYPAKIVHEGDICMPDSWEAVMEYVHDNGKYDFAICTHTLEDIANPLFVTQQISKIAKRGFIAVPSKYMEANKWNDYRGFIHHRWIFDSEDGVRWVGYPKIGYFETRVFDGLAGMSTHTELCAWWQDEIELRIINHGYLGPSVEAVKEYYNRLLL